MAESSVETLRTAVQALYRVHAVEGPPGENGLRTVWHLGQDGAELLSLVDGDGRVQRQIAASAGELREAAWSPFLN